MDSKVEAAVAVAALGAEAAAAIEEVAQADRKAVTRAVLREAVPVEAVGEEAVVTTGRGK